MSIFNHSSPKTSLVYIGLYQEEKDGVAYTKMIFRTLRKLEYHKCKYLTR